MASLARYEKIGEDDALVEYRFGTGARLDRVLVLDKRTMEVELPDGRFDTSYTMVVSDILGEKQRLGYYPVIGSCPSERIESPSERTDETDWQPANDVERELANALLAGDRQAYFRLLTTAELYMPRFLSDPPERRRVFAVDLLGYTYLPVFTSTAALARQFGDVVDGYSTTNYAELRSKWPDPQWRLAVNPGTPIDAYVRIESVAAAAEGRERIHFPPHAVVEEMAAEDAEPPAPPPDAAPRLQAAAEEHVRELARWVDDDDPDDADYADGLRIVPRDEPPQ